MTRPSPVSSATASAPPPVDGTNAEADFVVILAALLCALICTVGLIAVLRCTWLRRSPAGNGSPPCHAAANKGIKKKVLQTLPKFTYGAPASSASPPTSSECSICLAEFAEGDEVRVLPQCGHGFHVACIDTWLVSCSSCPSCRRVLVVGACQKCGAFPMAHGEAEPELKEGQVGQSGNRIPTNNDNHFLP